MKKIHKAKLLILFSFSILSCSPTKEHTNYKLARKAYILSENTKLQTSGVYLRTGVTSGAKYYNFIRFFKTGKCFISNTFNGEVSIDSLYSIDRRQGEQCFYKSDVNKLTIEEWGGYYTGYTYLYGIIKKDSIIITSLKPRGLLTSIQKLPEEPYYFLRLDSTVLSTW